MIFVDSSFWIALHNPRDPRHAGSVAALRRVGHEQLITTSHVRGETWTFLRRRAGHPDAVRFLDNLERSSLARVVHVSEELEAEALRWLRRHDERRYSMVDATSFVTMRAMHIRDVLTLDGDFVAAGFRTLS